MRKAIENLWDPDQSRYYVPYLPPEIIRPLGVGSLSLAQRPNAEAKWRASRDAPIEMLSRTAVSSFDLPPIYLPRSITNNSDLVDKFMIHTIQSSMGIPELIAVIDTGIMMDHPLLRASVVGQIDLTGEGPVKGADLNGHGTVVALLILLTSPNVQFVNIKIANADGRFEMSTLAEGIREAIKLAPSRISLSLGTNSSCSRFKRCPACQAAIAAVEAGIMVFAASGNTPNETACPAQAPGVFSIASYELRSRISETSSLAEHELPRLRGGLSDDVAISLKALETAQYFVSLYQQYRSANDVEKALLSIKSAVNLAKEAARLNKSLNDKVVVICQQLGARVFQDYPTDLSLEFVRHLWYHIPDHLVTTLRGEVNGGILPGSSYAVATAMAIPSQFADVTRKAFGEYPITDWVTIKRAAYSGDGEFAGADGRFLFVPFELGLMERAVILREQFRTSEVMSKYDSREQSELQPAEMLEIAMLELVEGKFGRIMELLSRVLQQKPDWKFARYLLEDLKSAPQASGSS